MRQSLLNQDIILTTEQEKCLKLLEKGNLFISAPTSFGKTYIAFEYIIRNIKKINNIIFVVPTISLMNELRKKCFHYFGEKYMLITSEAELEQNYFELKKIIIVVPERINTKLFQKYLKISPSQYLQQYRLSKACTLLRKTSLSITDISYTVGFQHAPYFTKLFTQYIGETPSEYRKEYMRFGEDSFS